MTHNSAWKELIAAPIVYSRDLDHDSVTFIHGQSFLNKMSDLEKSTAYDLIGLSLNESFLYFERLLIYTDYYMRNKTKSTTDNEMKQVDIDELTHLQAFRAFNSNNRSSKKYYTQPNGKLIKPGQVMQTNYPLQHKFALFLLKKFPECIYPIAILFERFSVDIGRTLVRDHGRNSSDSFVQLHYLHLKDEVLHINVCERKMKSVMKSLPIYKIPLYAIILAFLTTYFLKTPFTGLKNVIYNLPTIKNSFWNKVTFFLASTGLTYKQHPAHHTRKIWFKKMANLMSFN